MAPSAHGFAPVVGDEAEGSDGGDVRGRSIPSRYGRNDARCVLTRRKQYAPVYKGLGDPSSLKLRRDCAQALPTIDR